MFSTNQDQREAEMPFVLCRSNGGPYEDEAFMSGWRMGDLDATLASGGIAMLADSVRPIERRQADLIAMARGYTMAVEASGDPDWLSVTFSRSRDEG